jgi:HD-GYP domain-containing protein (c-di-GMP phosphodiesterase class II)
MILAKSVFPIEFYYKKGKLTEAEYREMQRHSEIGQRIALASPELSSLAI